MRWLPNNRKHTIDTEPTAKAIFDGLAVDGETWLTTPLVDCAAAHMSNSQVHTHARQLRHHFCHHSHHHGTLHFATSATNHRAPLHDDIIRLANHYAHHHYAHHLGPHRVSLHPSEACRFVYCEREFWPQRPPQKKFAAPCSPVRPLPN